MRSKRVFLAAAAVGFGLLGGCASVQVDEHSYQFNEATGSLGLRLLLLNAVRASKDYPLQFSKINAYQGTGTMGASVSAAMPLQLFPGNGTVTPKVDWKDGVSQLNLIDLNTEEAQQALKRPVTFEMYKYYARFHGSRSMSAIDMLMFEYIVIPKVLHNLIIETVQEHCRHYLEGKMAGANARQLARRKFVCSELRAMEAQCPDLHAPAVESPDGLQVMLRNDLGTECRHKAFVAATLQFDVLGVAADKAAAREATAPAATRKAGGNTFNIYVTDTKGGDDKKVESERGVARAHDKLFAAKCKKVVPKLCPPGSGDAQPIPGDFQFRSPERMVRYLGELIAAQHYNAQRFAPKAVDPDLQEVFTLLKIERGAPLPGQAAVTIRDPEGDVFYVPRTTYALPREDRSLEALSFVSDVLNGAVSRKAFPQVTTFSVSPSP